MSLVKAHSSNKIIKSFIQIFRNISVL